MANKYLEKIAAYEIGPAITPEDPMRGFTRIPQQKFPMKSSTKKAIAVGAASALAGLAASSAFIPDSPILGRGADIARMNLWPSWAANSIAKEHGNPQDYTWTSSKLGKVLAPGARETGYPQLAGTGMGALTGVGAAALAKGKMPFARKAKILGGIGAYAGLLASLPARSLAMAKPVDRLHAIEAKRARERKSGDND